MNLQSANDFNRLQKELFKIRTFLEEMNGRVATEIGQIKSDVTAMGQSVTDLQVDHEELIRLRQQSQLLNGTIHEWQKRSIDYLRSIENALSNPELDPAYRRSLEKTVRDFRRMMAAMGLTVIIPVPGDPYDERVHQVMGENQSGSNTVSECKSWGFVMGDTVFAPAGVILGRPAASAPKKPEPFSGNPSIDIDEQTHDRAFPRPSLSYWISRSAAYGAIMMLGMAIGYLVHAPQPGPAAPISASQSESIGQLLASYQEQVQQNQEIRSKLDQLAQVIASGNASQPVKRKHNAAALRQKPMKSQPDVRMYTVKPGDTLWRIAVAFYGNGNDYKRIMDENQMKRPHLTVGSQLKIPSRRSSSSGS